MGTDESFFFLSGWYEYEPVEIGRILLTKPQVVVIINIIMFADERDSVFDLILYTITKYL